VLVQFEGLEAFHDSEKGGYWAKRGTGGVPNKGTRLSLLAVLLFKPSEFRSMHKVRLCKCRGGGHSTVVLTPEFLVVNTRTAVTSTFV